MLKAIYATVTYKLRFSIIRRDVYITVIWIFDYPSRPLWPLSDVYEDFFLRDACISTVDNDYSAVFDAALNRS